MASKAVLFGLAQLGYKPGARKLLRSCLGRRELPQQERWRRADQRTYRTAYASRDTTWGANARSVRSVSVWRSFVTRRRTRYLQLNLVPLATIDDVPEAMEAARTGGLRNFRARVRIVETVDVELPTGVVGASNVRGVEQTTRGRGLDGIVRTLYFTVGRFLVTFVATGVYHTWTWDELLDLAARQAARLPAEQQAPGFTPSG